MTRLLRTFLSCSLLLASCASHPEEQPEPDGLTEDGIVLELCEMRHIDHVEVMGISTFDHSFYANVMYEGGCREHHFRLCWSGRFSESYAVETDVMIIHDDGGDTCTDVVTQTLRFGFAPLEEAWREEYGTDSGTVIINVDGHSAVYNM